jgi:hypothetical protein
VSSFSKDAGGSKLGGGGKGGGGGGGGSDSATDNAAAVKNTMNEFTAMMGRDPASTEANNADATGAEGESLFVRCHNTYVRSVLGGKVTARSR